MLHKILVAIDSPETSHDVFEQALILSQATGAYLGLLHVTDPDETNEQDLPAYLANMEPYLDEADESGPRCFMGHFETFEKEMFGIYVDQATSSEVNTECIRCFGDPEQAICDFATVWQADVIVLGRRGRTGIVEFFLGSVSNYIVHHAPCSVYIVHRSPEIQPQTASAKSIEVLP